MSTTETLTTTTTTKAPENPKSLTIVGRVLSILATLFLLTDSVPKILQIQMVRDSLVQFGYPETAGLSMGIALLIFTLLYAAPRTNVLGAILLTAYLGGAMATNFRVEAPIFTHVMFPVYVALFVWGGLFFRYPQIRSLIPFRRPAN